MRTRTIKDIATALLSRAKVLGSGPRKGTNGVFARRTVSRILGDDYTGWTNLGSNADVAAAFLVWARKYAPEGPIQKHELIAAYVDWCYAEQVRPIAENVLIQELKRLGIPHGLANYTLDGGERFRPTIYTLRPARAGGRPPASTSVASQRLAA